MEWYEVLALGVVGGIFVGGLFYLIECAAIWVANRRDRMEWEREMDDMRDESGS